MAIARPAQAEGVEIEDSALDLVVEQTQCFPYFLQEWGKHLWDVAESSPIAASYVEAASVQAIAGLDESFFRVRFDRLTPAERKYLRAMAQTRRRPSPFRGYIAGPGAFSAVTGAHPQPVNQQRNGVESEPWGYRIYSAFV